MIYVNRNSKTIQPPTIQLVGKLVDFANGEYGSEHNVAINTTSTTTKHVDHHAADPSNPSGEDKFYTTVTTSTDISTVTISKNQITIDGQVVTKTGRFIFRGDVAVTLIPDTKYSASPHYSSGTFVGELHAKQSNFNNLSETFYTVNGKDPRQTMNNVYKGPFTLKYNKSGCDNVILKTRSYCKGKASSVRTVDIRVKRDNWRAY